MALVGTPGGPVDTLQAIPVFDVAPPFILSVGPA
jgi:hypothetical protein